MCLITIIPTVITYISNVNLTNNIIITLTFLGYIILYR
jgi:hypothetical protein